MLRKILVISVLSLFVVVSLSCKETGNKYGDLKEFMNETIDVNEDYMIALEKASNAKDVAKAITDLGNRMKEFSAKQEELQKKYPELKTIDKNNPPPELQEEFDRLEKMGKRMAQASMKMMKYMMDPEVMKASREMAKGARKSSMFK